MALKDRFRRAIGRPADRSASISSSSTKPGTGSTTPNENALSPTNTHTSTNHLQPTNTNISKTNTNTGGHPPRITLTRSATSNSLLTKTLTWRSSNTHSDKNAATGDKNALSKKEKKAVEAWKKQDADEWSAPKNARPGKKNQVCQDTLRAFDFKQFDGEKGGVGERTMSVGSQISPNQSRAGSVVDVHSGTGGAEGTENANHGAKNRGSVGPGRLSHEVVFDDHDDSKREEEKKALRESVGAVKEE